MRRATPATRRTGWGKVLREARDSDAWCFTSPAEVARLYPLISRHLGRRRRFWEFLLGLWRREGLLVAALSAVAAEMGARVKAVTTSPDFRRRLVRRRDEAVIVDLVRDRVPQTTEDKPVIDGIRVDPPEEIFANKLCTLLSRAEVRDLVDVRALEQAGYDLGAALNAGSRKDGGLTPGQLAWVLSEIRIGTGAKIPGGVSPDELRQYLGDLIGRLGRMAFPGQ